MAIIRGVLNPPEEYLELNENSSYEEKIDVVLRILSKGPNILPLKYNLLYIQSKDERLFDALLKETEFVSLGPAIGYMPTFKLNDTGLIMMYRYGSYKNYLAEKEKIKEQKEQSDERQIKNYILKAFEIKGINIPYYFDQIYIDTGYSQNTVSVCCEEFAHRGYVSKTQEEASLEPRGLFFIECGGYKADTPAAIINNIIHKGIHVNGDFTGNANTGNNNTQSERD